MKAKIRVSLKLHRPKYLCWETQHFLNNIPREEADGGNHFYHLEESVGETIVNMNGAGGIASLNIFSMKKLGLLDRA